MIAREISKKVLEYAEKFPVVTITGPRQSGKTTLSRALFPGKSYVSMEELDNRNYAQTDPRGFLSQYPEGAVIDEVQRTPDLLSYIQGIVDEKNQEGLFILTGSQQFEMMSRITQSLAGRTAIVKLLPFTLQEAYPKMESTSINEVLYTGFFPRIFDKKIKPADAAGFYINTYLERDVRQIINIRDITRFETFLQLCAGRTGQLVNLNAIADETGVSQNTIKSWLSVLEASYIIKLLRPYHKRITRRLVKTPKLYFLDTGLAVNLIGIKSADHLKNHPLKGALFETLIVSELLKKTFNRGERDNLFFYRDQKGHEMDIVLDNGFNLDLVEVKLSQTLNTGFLKGFSYFPEIKDIHCRNHIVYGGDRNSSFHGVEVHSWKNMEGIQQGK